jgi:signal transduction histidine kinase
MTDRTRSRLRAIAFGPHRSGWTVRLRLTALYGSLFLVSGGVLLGITYVLVSHRLPPSGVFVSRSVNGPNSAIRILVQGAPVKTPPGRSVQVIGGGAGGQISDGIGRVLPPPGAILGQVRTLAEETRASSLHQLVVDSGIALAIMAIASSGLGWLIAGRALRPLRAMTGAAQAISEHNLHERLPEDGPRDELRNLAATFNALLGRLEAAFDSQRRFVANASHELRTPLTLERAIVEVALADPDADVARLRAMATRVLEIGAEQEAIIDALITLARSQRGLDERRPVDLAATVETVLATTRAQAADRAITVEADLRPACAAGDDRLLERLVANLADNAVRHNYPGGWVGIETVTEGGRATLKVSNSGPVVADGDIERLVQPFQRAGPERTTRAAGLGLGLSIVEAIGAAHGAEFRLTTRPAGGLDALVTFPAASVPEADPSAAAGFPTRSIVRS